MLVGLRATHKLSDVVRDIKKGSSTWIHQEIGISKFAWQDGYGAFTVSQGNLAAVSAYISDQEEHHRTRTFQEEYLEFLRDEGIDFDERYLW